MNKTNKEIVIEDIARDSLNCIEKVAADAEDARASHKRGDAKAFTTINTLNSPQAVKSIRSISDSEAEAIAALIQQPVIARVHFLDENEEEETIFITRTTPRSVPGYKIASYRSDLGKIASLAAGDEGYFKFGVRERDLLIDSRALLRPERTSSGWDSRETEIDIRDLGRFTVRSLREFLAPEGEIEEGDLEALWNDDTDENIIEGVRRAIITHMGLRDQPVLDRRQDEIFRMPINTKCFLSGPPGTGKTTTLIRRLGQKTDRQALQESPQELRLIEQVEEETNTPHETSWVVFSPTELLRQYVKEAFAREGLAASDIHIRTWEEFRSEIARDGLKLLKTSSGSGPFVERRAQNYLKDEIANESAWYDDFRSYLDTSVSEELRADAKWLAVNPAEDLNAIGRKLSEILDSPRKEFYAYALRNVTELVPDIRQAISERSEAISGILAKARNALVIEDRNFPDILRDEISRQLANAAQPVEDVDDFEVALDDDDQVPEELHQSGRPINRRQALVRFERALKASARARLAKRAVSEKSQDGMLLAWLGEERIPSDEELAKLGKLLLEQARLRKFERLEHLFLRRIAPKYKRFRAERAAASRWYASTPAKPSDIFWKELDLVVLATLQIANELLGHYRRHTGSLPEDGLLGSVRGLQRAQVLIDEATDFSRVQLASMHEISHPTASSLFLCGDLNQRLTSWGIKTNQDLNWIAKNIQRKTITVSYRQSQRLVDLAKDVASLGGAQAEDIILPERLDAEGLPPVWQDALTEHNQVSDWLTNRIREIDRMLQRSTTIAVLVNEEADVEPLARALNDRLEEISLSAVACKDGKVVGNDRDVRVFDIRHIKGLEFEAVFFIGLDETIAKHPDLFSKFLYVGATRAATFLGVTFNGGFPDLVEPLSAHFQRDWAAS